MLEDLIKELKEGIDLDSFSVITEDVEKGRLKDQFYLPIYLVKGGEKKRLLYMSVYLGNPPHYRGWIELFGINDELTFNGDKISYFDSNLERELISLISSHSRAGEKLFIEYQQDEETLSASNRGIPEPLTRLGHLLFQNGYTWFKDWYFAEGFNEGGQKLQGEKPIDGKNRQRHFREIVKDVKRFLSNRSEEMDKVEENAVERARELIAEVDR
ncbi:MAG: DUF1122 family protein [Candidatus Saliniplasma sp.]